MHFGCNTCGGTLCPEVFDTWYGWKLSDYWGSLLAASATQRLPASRGEEFWVFRHCKRLGGVHDLGCTRKIKNMLYAVGEKLKLCEVTKMQEVSIQRKCIFYGQRNMQHRGIGRIGNYFHFMVHERIVTTHFSVILEMIFTFQCKRFSYLYRVRFQDKIRTYFLKWNIST